MIFRETLWFTEKIYDLARNSKRQKCPYVMFFLKNWVLKIQKTDTFTKTYQTRFEKISLVLSRNLSFFLSISRFILSPYNGSENDSIRCRNGSGNGTNTRRGTGNFVFCFVSIVLMYEWLNMKIKRNVDRFSEFLKTNGRENFVRGFTEKS